VTDGGIAHGADDPGLRRDFEGVAGQQAACGRLKLGSAEAVGPMSDSISAWTPAALSPGTVRRSIPSRHEAAYVLSSLPPRRRGRAATAADQRMRRPRPEFLLQAVEPSEEAAHPHVGVDPFEEAAAVGGPPECLHLQPDEALWATQISSSVASVTMAASTGTRRTASAVPMLAYSRQRLPRE